MSQIIPKEGGGRIIWDKDDWTNGLAPNWTTSLFPVVLGGNKITAMSAINPFRKWGVALPGYSPSAATNSSIVSAYLRKGLVNGTNVYIISNGALLHRFDGTSTITNDTAGTGYPHTISAHGGHTTVVANDCVLYNAKIGGTSAERYFYSWSDNTDWDVGVITSFSATPNTFDDDFMSTAPATPLDLSSGYEGGANKPHPMIVGDDDILYIADRNFLHAYDGQDASDDDGKFFPAVLTLPYGWIITSMEKTIDGLMIFAYYSTVTTDNYRGQAKAWEWKYNELDITRSYNLNDNFTGESFTIGTTIGVFTQGRIADPQNTTKTAKIQLFDGTKFKQEVAFIGTMPIRGGVEVDGQSITWNSGGVIYSYGSKTLGLESGLNKIGVASSGTSTGMLGTFFDSNNIMAVSAGTTTSGGLQLFSTNYESTIGESNCFLLTSLAEPQFPIDMKGRIISVTLQFSNTVTPANSTELTVKLCDRLNTQQTIISQHTQVTTAQEQIIKRKNDTSNAPLMGFDGLALLLVYTRQSGTASASFGVTRVVVDYENYKAITT